MAENSKIEWTETTWNPIVGCSRKSDGCTNCYAEKMTKRLAAMGLAKYQGLLNEHDRFNGVLRLDESDLLKPLSWKKPKRVFVNSMSDLFHENAKDEWIDRVFAVMALTPHITYQVLTKRPDRMAEYITKLRERWGVICDLQIPMVDHISRDTLKIIVQCHLDKGTFGKFIWPLPNVWLGISVEDQKTADERIPHLLATPAAVRFLSIEPLLGPVNLSAFFGKTVNITGERIEQYNFGISWIIVGGESGPNARPMHVDWVRSIREQCRAAGVPVFVKQLGASVWDRNDAGFDGDYPHEWPMDTQTDDWHLDPTRQYQGAMCRIMLSDRKGGNWDEWPEDLRIREFPNV